MYNEILKELLRVGIKVGALKKKDLESAIIDTRVQIKNIKHPHDAYLMEKARKYVVGIGICKRLCISLNETYAKSFKNNIMKVWKYSKDSKVKKWWKIMKKLKTLLGRFIRICDRETSNLQLPESDQEILKRAKQIHAQSVLKKREKEKYKLDNDVLYSFHAPEVECLGKGKLNKPYEFGNKVGIAVSGRGNFIVAIKSFHGNPYDGHTLAQTIEELRAVVDEPLKKVFVDRGYAGNNFSEKAKIYAHNTKKKLSKDDKRMLKRRSAIEPIIGHLKNFYRMGRNYLQGRVGDIINPLISAIGLNLRCIANRLDAMQRFT